MVHRPVKVSVPMLTYDSERYVVQAIESVLAQEVDFTYELVIADNCSKDRTRDILLEYQRRHPERIRLLLRPVNIGIVKSFLDAYRECRGEYVACLPSDDYWTSPHKLQRQVDFLDRHPELAICFHRARIVPEDAPHESGLHPPEGAPIVATLEDLLQGDCIVACATMLRKLFSELPAWCEEMPLDDWPTFVLHAQHGGIGYLADEMAVYRLHSRSAWSSLSRLQKLPRKIETRQRMAAALGPPYDAILAPVIARLTAELRTLQEQSACSRREAA